MTPSADTSSAHRPALSVWRCAARVLKLWLMRRSQRETLAELDDHLLRDIGRSRDDARRESGKPFWRD